MCAEATTQFFDKNDRNVFISEEKHNNCSVALTETSTIAQTGRNLWNFGIEVSSGDYSVVSGKEKLQTLEDVRAG